MLFLSFLLGLGLLLQNIFDLFVEVVVDSGVIMVVILVVTVLVVVVWWQCEYDQWDLLLLLELT